jgi:hypothetical protein
MEGDSRSHILNVLNLPSPDDIQDWALRKEYLLFSRQLEWRPSADIVLSDPYFFDVETEGLLDSVEGWIRSLSSTANARLFLLSILSRPFDPTKVWPGDERRFIDDPFVALLFGPSTISLAEGTSGVPFGIDALAERKKVLSDRGMKQLLKGNSPRSAIETLTSEFIGGQPGNYAYQAWQIADWNRDWAAVFGVSNAAHEEGYPFRGCLGSVGRITWSGTSSRYCERAPTVSILASI